MIRKICIASRGKSPHLPHPGHKVSLRQVSTFAPYFDIKGLKVQITAYLRAEYHILT